MPDPSRLTCDDDSRLAEERTRGGVHSIGEVLAEWLARFSSQVWEMKEPTTPG